jgi:hypothetical protein
MTYTTKFNCLKIIIKFYYKAKIKINLENLNLIHHFYIIVNMMIMIWNNLNNLGILLNPKIFSQILCQHFLKKRHLDL